MNYIQLFTFENQKVRMVTVDGEPYFASKDVAIIWIYGNPTKAPRTHVTRKPILDTLGGKQRTTMIKQVRTLQLDSKQQASDLRKHEAYLSDKKIEELLTGPDTIIELTT